MSQNIILITIDSLRADHLILNAIKQKTKKVLKVDGFLFKTLRQLYKTTTKNYIPYASAEYINQIVLNWIKNKKSEKFFLFIHYMDVHMPYIPQAQHLEELGCKSISDEKEMWKLNEKNPENITSHELKKLIYLYDAKVRHVDHEIGFLINILNELNILENSTLIITADHGDEFMEHGSLGHSAKLYDELLLLLCQFIHIYIFHEICICMFSS